MKRIVFAFVILFVIFSFCACFEKPKTVCEHINEDNNTSCDLCGEPMEHEHTFSEEYTFDDKRHWQNATCEHDRVVDNLDYHYLDRMEWVVEREPTCGEAGLKIKKCAVCDYKIEKSIDKLRHPTDGVLHFDETHHWDEYTCEHESYKYEHSWELSETIKEPTCKEEGEGLYACSTCDATKNEPLEKAPHKEAPKLSSNDEYHWREYLCGCEELIEYVEHNWYKKTIVTRATCKEEGLERRTCMACAITVDFAIPKKEHNYSKYSYSSDRESHWRLVYCGCDVRPEEELHSFDETNKCTICEYQLTADDGLIYELAENNTVYVVVGIYDKEMTEAVIPEESLGKPVTEIRAGAFNGAQIQSISISKTITKIENGAFANLSKLNKITVDDENERYSSIESCLIDKTTSTLVLASSKSSIPSDGSVKIIGEKAFSGLTELEKITIPSAITEIGAHAFSGTTAEIELESSLDTITSYAFAGYLGKSFNIPKGIKTVKENAFLDSSARIIFNEGLETIEKDAFKNCIGIVDLYLPSSLLTIDSGAFSGCSSVSSVNLPFVGIKRDSSNADALFGNIFGTTEYEGGTYTTQYYSTSNSRKYYIPTALEKITVRAGKISFGAFSGCKTVKTVVVEDEVTSIARRAFYNCIAIEEMTLPFVGMSLTQEKNTEYSVFGHIFGVQTNSGGVTQRYSSSGSKIYSIPTSIKSVTITGGTLSYGAFYNCWFIEHITIPDNLDQIDLYAFYNCELLKEINIPSTVKELGKSCFSECVSLEQIEIPKELSLINDYAFSNAKINRIVIDSVDSWARVEISNNHASPLFVGELYINGEEISGELVLPDDIETIHYGAFYGCDKITSVVVPASVLTISERAFEGCIALRDVTFNEGLTTINSNAFYKSGIEKLSPPSTLKTIGANAFCDCPYLVSATLPSGLSALKSSAFYNCFKLAEVYNFTELSEQTITASCVNAYAKYIHTAEGDSLYVQDENGFVFLPLDDVVYLVDYQGEERDITLPSNYNGLSYQMVKGLFRYMDINSVDTNGAVKVLEEKAFEGSSVARLTLTGVKTISPNAFSKCAKLTEIVLDDTMSYIGEGAFANCTSLKSITMPKGITTVTSSLFNGCASLESVVLTSQIVEIESMAFYNCESLTSITNATSILEIGSSSFFGCTSLTNVRFDKLTSVGEQSFFGCTSLQTVDAPFLNTFGKSSFYGCESLSLVNNTKANLITIEEDAFENCKSLSAISLKNATVGNYAFKGCVSLILENEDVLLSVGMEAFKDLPQIKCVYFSSVGSEISIGSYAFAGSALETISLSKYVSKLGEGAFMNCMELTTIIHNANLSNLETDNLVFANAGINGDGITLTVEQASATIPNNMFYPSTSEEAPMTPKLVKMQIREASSLGENAFRNCIYLENIVVPQHTSILGSYAYYNCLNAKTILYCPFEATSTGTNTFDKVGTGLTDGTELVIANSVEVIPSNLFGAWENANRAFIKKMSFESGSVLKTIKSYAFAGVDRMTTVEEFPRSLQRIEYYAFVDCTRIEKVFIPTSVTHIGSSAFWGCGAYKYCEASSRPDGWASSWEGNGKVYWGKSGY